MTKAYAWTSRRTGASLVIHPQRQCPPQEHLAQMERGPSNAQWHARHWWMQHLIHPWRRCLSPPKKKSPCATHSRAGACAYNSVALTETHCWALRRTFFKQRRIQNTGLLQNCITAWTPRLSFSVLRRWYVCKCETLVTQQRPQKVPVVHHLCKPSLWESPTRQLAALQICNADQREKKQHTPVETSSKAPVTQAHSQSVVSRPLSSRSRTEKLIHNLVQARWDETRWEAFETQDVPASCHQHWFPLFMSQISCFLLHKSRKTPAYTQCQILSTDLTDAMRQRQDEVSQGDHVFLLWRPADGVQDAKWAGSARSAKTHSSCNQRASLRMQRLKHDLTGDTIHPNAKSSRLLPKPWTHFVTSSSEVCGRRLEFRAPNFSPGSTPWSRLVNSRNKCFATDLACLVPPACRVGFACPHQSDTQTSIERGKVRGKPSNQQQHHHERQASPPNSIVAKRKADVRNSSQNQSWWHSAKALFIEEEFLKLPKTSFSQMPILDSVSMDIKLSSRIFFFFSSKATRTAALKPPLKKNGTVFITCARHSNNGRNSHASSSLNAPLISRRCWVKFVGPESTTSSSRGATEPGKLTVSDSPSSSRESVSDSSTEASFHTRGGGASAGAELSLSWCLFVQQVSTFLCSCSRLRSASLHACRRPLHRRSQVSCTVLVRSKTQQLTSTRNSLVS